MAEAARELLLCLLVLGVGDIFCVKVVETGKSYTFKPAVSGTPETILWKFQKNKVVEFENNDDTWYRLEGRADLNTITGDFTIKQLRKEDSGLYDSEIQVKGKLEYSTHEIKVIDPVPVPTVTCHTNSTTVTLQCSVGSSVQAEFEWSGPNEFKETGEKIIVSKGQAIYICTAQNQVNKESKEFSLTDCNTDGSDGVLAGILAAVFIAILGLIGGIGVVLYIRKRKNSREINPENGKNNPNNGDETFSLLNKEENPSEINERSDQAPNSQEHLNDGSERDESGKSTDNHLERHESHLDELPSKQNDKESQETILKTESEENNKPSEEEEPIPVNKHLTEGNQENTLKPDTEPQIKDAKGQSEEQSVGEEDKEKKEQQDDTMDESANTSNSGENQEGAGQNPEENPHTENNDIPSSSIPDKDQGVKKEIGRGNSGENQEGAGQNPEENPHTENNDIPSSSIPDKDQGVKKEIGRGNSGENQEGAGQNPEENPHTENNDIPSSSIPDKDQGVKKEIDRGNSGENQEGAGQNPEENPHTENNDIPSSSIPDKDQGVKKEIGRAAGRVVNTVMEIENRVWKPKEIFSKKTNQENGNI
ncbi:hypothetical protein MHYP_G00068310 [Metynnis hypsauchen]